MGSPWTRCASSFRGRASDATDAAFKGVNALTAAYRFADAIEGQSWPPESVVNHVLLDGGTIPSIVPEQATQWFFIHARDRAAVAALRERIDAIAEETARTTGTELEVQVLSSASEWLINRELGGVLDRHLQEDSAIVYTADEFALAQALRTDFSPEGDDAFFNRVIPPQYTDEPVLISDDTAEASWITPRGGFLIACFPADVPSHSWQWAAVGELELRSQRDAPCRTHAHVDGDRASDERTDARVDQEGVRRGDARQVVCIAAAGGTGWVRSTI